MVIGGRPGFVPGFLLFVLFAVWAGTVSAQRLVDPDGLPILDTSVRVSVGDEFISPGGFRYRVASAWADKAVAERLYDYPDKARFPSRRESGNPVSLGLTTSRPFEGYMPDDSGNPEMTLGEFIGAEFSPTADVDVGIGKYDDKGNPPSVLADIQRDGEAAGFVSLPPRGDRASSVLMVVDAAEQGWGYPLGIALVWKSLADTLAPGLVRGVLVRGSGGAAGIVRPGPYRVTLLVGDRFHRPEWAMNSIRELSGMLPGAVGGIRPGHVAAPAFISTLISRMRGGGVVGADGEVVRGPDFGYVKWAVSALVLIIVAFGSVALHVEGGIRARYPARSLRRFGAAAAAFLGSLAGTGVHRRKRH